MEPLSETVIQQRGTVLLGEAGDRLLDYIGQGYSFKRACALAAVSHDTFRWWMLRGADPESLSSRVCPQDCRVEPYWTFARNVRRAERAGKQHAPAGPRSGRLPSPLSPEAQTVILNGLSQGWTYHAVARAAGVRLSTLLSWMRLGGYPRRLQEARPLIDSAYVEPYVGFVKAVLAAEETYLADALS